MANPPSVSNLWASELALLAIAIGAVGITLRQAGWCIGNLRPNDIVLTRAAVLRTKPGRLRSLVMMRRQRRHLRVGHDRGCGALGVPLSTMHALLRHHDESDALSFIFEACVRAVELTPTGHLWSSEEAEAELRDALSRCITPASAFHTHATGAAPRFRVRNPRALTLVLFRFRGLLRTVLPRGGP